MEYLGAWGTLIHEKNLKSKISCQTPFKRSEKLFCIGPTRAAKAGQKISCTGKSSPITQPMQYLFHMYSLSPYLPQFK